jgi:Sulfotransferase family
MQNGTHFISGLPRSGSTLLAAILRQKPRFHPSSPPTPVRPGTCWRGSDGSPRAMWSQVRLSGVWRMGWDSNPR